MSKPNLQTLLKKYQKRLFLQDFTITIRYGTMLEVDGVGRTKIRWHLGLADILILDPKENVYDNASLHNIELTVVHELIHIIFYPITNTDSKGLEDNVIEQSIEKLARAVIDARP